MLLTLGEVSAVAALIVRLIRVMVFVLAVFVTILSVNAMVAWMKMKSGKQIAINAMRKEYARLKRIAVSAKSESDECMNSLSERIKINNEFVEIVKSRETGPQVLRKLESLRKRYDKAI